MTINTPPNTPPAREDEPGLRGTYGQGDYSRSAQRSRSHKDQHYAAGGGSGEIPDPYGEGGFAAGDDARDGPRQSGYGADFGQLEASQRSEKRASELDYKKAGTPVKSSR